MRMQGCGREVYVLDLNGSADAVEVRVAVESGGGPRGSRSPNDVDDVAGRLVMGQVQFVVKLLKMRSQARVQAAKIERLKTKRGRRRGPCDHSQRD